MAGYDRATLHLSPMADGNGRWCNPSGKQFGSFLKKLHTIFILRSSNSTAWHPSQNNENLGHRKTRHYSSEIPYL